MGKKKIYTSLDGFQATGYKVYPHTILEDKFVEWIAERSISLLCRENKAETRAFEELRAQFGIIDRQPFFMIHGHSYFLDFYEPTHRLAIEIDGGSHKFRKKEDAMRDMDFMDVGIKTCRVTSTDVMRGNLCALVHDALSDPKTNTHKKSNRKKKREQNRKTFKKVK